jgi:phthiocerol/phenolphthiocerol synthesis type-I polyketide synthase E
MNQQRSGMTGMDDVLKHADDLLEQRFRSETLDCELRTLSDVMSEWRVGRIDLLKIDVQKSELDVLEGIAGDDWVKIQQIVIEIHDIDGRLALVRELLDRHGYTSIVEQDDPYGNSIMYNVYATRRPSLVTFESEASLTSTAKPHAQDLQTRARRQAGAAGRQKRLATRRKQGS